MKVESAPHTSDPGELEVCRQRIQDLEQEMALYRTYFGSAPIGKVITNAKGVIMKANQAFAAMIGCTPEELEGVHFREVTHPDDLAGSCRLVAELLSGVRDVSEIDNRYISRTGRIVHAHVVTRLLRLEDGTPVHFLTHIQDVTERHDNLLQLSLRLSLMEYAFDHTLEEIMARALEDLENLTDSVVGFFHFVESDQEHLHLQAWSRRTRESWCKAVPTSRHYAIADAGV